MQDYKTVLLLFFSLSLIAGIMSCGGDSGPSPIVSDNNNGVGDISADSNNKPVANAGPDQSVSTGSLVILDGSGSSDADGDSLTYSWSFTAKPDNSTASLNNPSIVNPSFTADIDGTYELELVVNDGKTNSSPDSATITVAP